ncbi:MAG: S-adenosylmethionine/S-adenosylhomocysteine transporter [Candidatus Anoxychlamydiales bacterium]|nr:S-adenosylmethionine/S-adenosylhomocysteine transporter [Candidatus Anoxychlamydiales bacterium]
MLFLPFLLFAMWSSCFALGKMAIFSSTPLFFTATRMLLAAFLILGYMLLRKRSQLKISKKQFFAIGILALLSMYLTNALEFYGLKHLSASKTCFIYSLTPIFAAIFSYIHFKEKLSLKKMLGMSIALLGIIPVFFIQSGSAKITSSFFHISLPEIAVIVAVIFSVYGWVLLRMLVKNNSVSPLTANGIGMLLGGIFALTHSYFFDAWTPIPVSSGHNLAFIQGILSYTIVSNIICYNLYGYLLKKYTATFMSFVGLLSPIFASFSEWVLLKTPPSPIILGSTCIIILGLYIVYKEELKQGYIVKEKKQKDADVAQEAS